MRRNRKIPQWTQKKKRKKRIKEWQDANGDMTTNNERIKKRKRTGERKGLTKRQIRNKINYKSAEDKRRKKIITRGIFIKRKRIHDTR